jgi:hypothetical protein
LTETPNLYDPFEDDDFPVYPGGEFKEPPPLGTPEDPIEPPTPDLISGEGLCVFCLKPLDDHNGWFDRYRTGAAARLSCTKWKPNAD